MAKAKPIDGSKDTPKGDKTFICPHDGSRLSRKKGREGYCELADGFPLMRWWWHPEALKGKGAWQAQGWACPFACPHCGHGLEWDGCCWSCGPKVGAPGDRYRRERTHWVYERGPEKPTTPEQHAAMLARFKALAASLA